MAKGKKTGGRTKGTPNKVTKTIREQYRLLIQENLDQLSEDLKCLEPKDRIKAVLDLSKFVLPTLKATELSIENDQEEFEPIVISIIRNNEDK